MTTSYNVSIPNTILRLGICTVDTLVIHGIRENVSRELIYELLQLRYPNSKRTARSLLKSVINSELDVFNEALSVLREDISPTDRLRLDTVYNRKICQILKFD